MEHQRAMLRLQAFNDFDGLVRNLNPVDHVATPNNSRPRTARITGAGKAHACDRKDFAQKKPSALFE
jgi:hypothetical protein